MSNIEKIVNFDTALTTKDKAGKTSYQIRDLELKHTDILIYFDTERVERIDYMLVSPCDIKLIKEDKKKLNNLLCYINILNTEHNKLVMLGCIYPIFMITVYYNHIELELIKFSSYGNALSKYVIKQFISTVGLNAHYTCPVKELVLKSKTDIINLGADGRIKITGMEYIDKFTGKSSDNIIYNAIKYNNGVLRFKNLSYMYINTESDYSSIHRIILEEGCTLTTIPNRLFEKFTNLKEIIIDKKLIHLLDNYITYDKNTYKILVDRNNKVEYINIIVK